MNYKYFLIAIYDWTGKIFYPHFEYFPDAYRHCGWMTPAVRRNRISRQIGNIFIDSLCCESYSFPQKTSIRIKRIPPMDRSEK
ncbi:MAG: hypothetical protein DSY90_03085 [Deltaproteobacteria bacterium]|nr:MAG: hypothetical protein DSY90_03085 [Deltaproteobacteria bacterium]